MKVGIHICIFNPDNPAGDKNVVEKEIEPTEENILELIKQVIKK